MNIRGRKNSVCGSGVWKSGYKTAQFEATLVYDCRDATFAGSLRITHAVKRNSSCDHRVCIEHRTHVTIACMLSALRQSPAGARDIHCE